MRVLFTTTGFPGHALPLLPLARALGRAGHEVCVAGPRSAGALVRRRALEFCGCADLPEKQMGRLVASIATVPRQQGHARMISEGFGGVAARALLADLLRLVGAWRPDVVVRESQEFAGVLAAERHGVPHVRVALGLASTEEETLTLAAAPVDQLRGSLGLPADPGAERLRASPCLTLVPPTLEHPGVPGAPQTYRFREPRAEPAPLPDWWPGNRDPLVYLSFGSVAGSLGFFPGLYQATLAALAELPVRVLVTTGEGSDPAGLGALPPNAHAERWVAQGVALPHAAAVVCHGGYGSMLGALARGLPLATVPLFGGDQWHNARRVAEIGAGLALEGATSRAFLEPPGREVMAALRDAAGRLLADPCYGRAAGRVAQEIEALPPIDAAAGVLEAIARRAEPPADVSPARWTLESLADDTELGGP